MGLFKMLDLDLSPEPFWFFPEDRGCQSFSFLSLQWLCQFPRMQIKYWF